jgi:hypothetical protein
MAEAQQQVIDADIVSEDSTSDTSSENGAIILMNMEAMIKSHITSIDKLKEEAEKHSSMLKDIFENDPTFKEHSEAAKEASRIKTATKNQILKRPDAGDLNEKVKSFKSQIKEQTEALSDYLREYQRMSGVNEIEGEDGEMREIVYVAKLIKKTSYPK